MKPRNVQSWGVSMAKLTRGEAAHLWAALRPPTLHTFAWPRPPRPLLPSFTCVGLPEPPRRLCSAPETGCVRARDFDPVKGLFTVAS